MELGLLDERNTREALSSVLADPYDNAFVIADLTGLRSGSIIVYSKNQGRVQGLLSLYTGLPFPAIATWCKEPHLFRKMLAEMAMRYPRLREGVAWCLCGRETLALLEKTVRIDSAREEVQMRLVPGRHDVYLRADGLTEVVALTADDVPNLNALYQIVPPEVWRAEEIGQGPYRGVYDNGVLVAAAGVHWVSPWLAEIGNVAVHPDFRRRGLGEACVSAVVAELRNLTERIYLMVFAENQPALGLYQKMGFEEVQRMWLVAFRLRGSHHLSRRRKLAAIPVMSGSALTENLPIEERATE